MYCLPEPLGAAQTMPQGNTALGPLRPPCARVMIYGNHRRRAWRARVEIAGGALPFWAHAQPVKAGASCAGEVQKGADKTF